MNYMEAGARPRTEPEVVMVGPKTFPPIIGGIETHVYEVSVRLAARGHRVTVLVPRTGGRQARTEDVDGVRVMRVPSIPTRYTLKLSSIPYVIKELRRLKGALVHAHDATGGYAAAVACDPRRLVYTMHGVGFHRSDWPTPFRQGIGMMQKMALRKAAHVFCTDETSKDAIRPVRDQAEVLSSGVDPDQFDRRLLPRPEEYEENVFTVLWIGRFTKVKGTDVMIEAMKRIDARKRSGMRFVFIGDGPMNADVMKAASSVKEIVHLGRIDHARIAPYVAHADTFVLPSLSEGLPISLLEAMAAGVPAVASDVGGVSSQMDRESLLLVRPQDPKGLAEAIERLHDDRPLARRLGDKGRGLVTSRFSWETVVDRLVTVYSQLSTL